jgi:signal transduction histidine kinase
MSETAGSTRQGHIAHARDDVSELLAHDLKSPLAAIAMNIEFALDELGDGVSPAAREALADCRQSNQRAVAILTDMVDALQLASGVRRPRSLPVDAQARLADALRRVATDAAARGVRLTWTTEPTSMRGDADLLDRALDRLLDRALRHAPTGGSVEVTLEGRAVVIRVASTESGVHPIVHESTTRSLATHFADAAMRAQGGAVLVDEDTEGGVRFIVVLPG